MRTHALSHARPLLNALAGAVLLAGATSVSAMAEDAHVKDMTFTVQTGYQAAIINVASSDGSKWDQILPGQITFWAHMTVDTRWPGYVDTAGIFLGQCENTQCGNGYPLLFATQVMQRDYNHQRNTTFSTAKIPVSGPGIAVVPYGDQILSKCNAQLQPDGATKAHSFSLPMTVSFTVNTRKDAGRLPPAEVVDGILPFNGGDHTRTGVFLAEVNCLATSRTTANPTPEPDPHRTKRDVKKIDLFLTTFAQPASSQRVRAARNASR